MATSLSLIHISLGVQAVALQADVRRPEACKQLVEDAAAAFGRLDVLVNNAGVTADKLLLQMTEADFDAVIETNLKGAFFCTKAAARLMIDVYKRQYAVFRTAYDVQPPGTGRSARHREYS